MFFSFSSSPCAGEVPLLFLPGWAFDGRLLPLYDVLHGQSCILPDSFVDPAELNENILVFLNSHECKKVRIVGWSMGAYLALDFCMAYPERVAGLDLVSMRKSWPREEIAAIRQGVCADQQGFLKEFYRKCFLGNKKLYREFVRELQDEYLSEINKQILLAGLSYLQSFTLPSRIPEGVSVRMIHGRKDIIVPFSDRAELTGATEIVINHGGHMVLLDRLKA